MRLFYLILSGILIITTTTPNAQDRLSGSLNTIESLYYFVQ